MAPILAPAGIGSWEVTGSLLTGLVATEIMVASMWQVFDTEPEEATEHHPSVGEDLAAIPTGFLAASRDVVLAIPDMVGWELRAEEDDDLGGLAAPLRDNLEGSSGGHGTAAALALMVFVLLYVPCFATIVALRQELGTRWAVLSVGLSLGVAWIGVTAVFQAGRLPAVLTGGG